MNISTVSFLSLLLLLSSINTTNITKLKSNSFSNKLNSNSKIDILNKDVVELKAQNQDFIKTKILDKEKDCISDYHRPYGEIESFQMKSFSLITIFAFISSLVLLFLIVDIIKKKANKYFSIAFENLANESFYFISLVAILCLFYVLQTLDSIIINWKMIIFSLFLYCFIWFLMCSLTICISYLVCYKWEELEKKSKSFKHTRQKYEKQCKNTDDSGNSLKVNSKLAFSYFEMFEFLILKTYFIVPFFPVFKPSVLKSNFSMSRYLKLCLLEKLNMLFKLSWTAWIISLVLILVWNVCISGLTFNYQLIILSCSPILGILLLIFMYMYFKTIYRRIVPTINNENYTEYKDLEEYNQNYATEKFLNYPLYLETIINKPEESRISKINYHSHIHGRTSSFYEDIIAFGASGFFIFFNIFQSIFLGFVLWITYVGVTIIPGLWKEYTDSNGKIYEYSTGVKVVVIIATIIYILLYSYLVAITLRWYTVISSVEMKRNEKCLNETIEEEIKNNSDMAESIFKSFKRIYFDMNLKSKDFKDSSNKINTLNKPILTKMLISVILKFKSIQSLEELNKYQNDDSERLISKSNAEANLKIELSISISNEMKLFLKTAGNNMTNDDIDYMLHMIENFDQYKSTQEVTQSQLFEIWAVITNFSTLKPENIVNFVFTQYFNERIELLNTNTLTEEGFLEFFRWYQEYFSSSNMEFIERQVSLMTHKNKEISIDFFVSGIMNMRMYHRN